MIHSGYRPGCIGHIVAMHGAYYSRTAGFGTAFEAKVARELAAFCESFDPDRDGLWLALTDEAVVGSIAIVGSQMSGDGAQIRWFIVADGYRGLGIGRRLFAEAMAFLTLKQCRRASLWTFRGLEAARHLYESHGFVLMEERPGDRWGTLVDEQCFVRSVT